jgi:hypothetical protein
MTYRMSAIAFTMVAALCVATGATLAWEDANYPDFKGQWVRNVGAQWDTSKPRGVPQQAPYTPEYQAIFEANLAELAAGGESYNPQMNCIPGGMPRVMIVYDPMEVIITPEITYLWIQQMGEFRRIYTDGRDWPRDARPTYRGYSIGRWEDIDRDGHVDTLVVETRNFKGPRTIDADGLPLHKDNQTIVKERIFLDGDNHNLLYDEITIIDHAFTRPWTVTRRYRRGEKPIWPEDICDEQNRHLTIRGESYFISLDGLLMPTRKDQPAPDLRLFNQPPR